MISQGIYVNRRDELGLDRDESVLDFCRLNDITVQAWSPVQRGNFAGTFVGDNENFPGLNSTLNRIAEKYGVSPTAIAIAWIARHPAGIQTVTGTTKTSRLKDCIAGTNVKLSRDEWYELFIAAGNILP
jgi:predicted oxidoreductase